jgi:hypothetical protein
MAMSAASAASATQLKQLKASPADRINGKIKLSTNNAQNGPNSQARGNADSASAAAGPASVNNAPNGTAATRAGQPDGLSPEQRRRVSGRTPLTQEEQKNILRKKVRLP